jgi:hypothetical protein
MQNYGLFAAFYERIIRVSQDLSTSGDDFIGNYFRQIVGGYDV